MPSLFYLVIHLVIHIFLLFRSIKGRKKEKIREGYEGEIEEGKGKKRERKEMKKR